jgi:hypothetical protein
LSVHSQRVQRLVRQTQCRFIDKQMFKYATGTPENMGAASEAKPRNVDTHPGIICDERPCMSHVWDGCMAKGTRFCVPFESLYQGLS